MPIVTCPTCALKIKAPHGAAFNCQRCQSPLKSPEAEQLPPFPSRHFGDAAGALPNSTGRVTFWVAGMLLAFTAISFVCIRLAGAFLPANAKVADVEEMAHVTVSEPLPIAKQAVVQSKPATQPVNRQINQGQADEARKQSEAALGALKLEQQRYVNASKLYGDQARAIADQQRASAGSFGLMTEDDQLRALGIAEHLSRGGSLSREDAEVISRIESLRYMMLHSDSKQSGLQRYVDANTRSAAQKAFDIREQQRQDADSFGLMSEDDQLRALDIGKRLSRGESLSREDIDWGRRIGPLKGMLASLGAEQAKRNGFFPKIEHMHRPGELSRDEMRQLNERKARENQEQAARIEKLIQTQTKIPR